MPISAHVSSLPLSILCGQLVVLGFEGEALPETAARLFAEGKRGGAILFRRNLSELRPACTLAWQVASAWERGPASIPPPFLAVDEEGGRVRRLPAPALALPAMGLLAAHGDLALVRSCASLLGQELLTIGFNVNFAPVLDVNSNPANPVIGDRSFGSDPSTVARFARAFLDGISSWVTPCGKHFPGHGDTSVDSHLALPRVAHSLARLEQIELVPFRAAIGAGIPALMSAHVVVEGLDASAPATLSSAISSELLRSQLGFSGVLFSDDLEMKAVSGAQPHGELGVRAVLAGCDVLLVCRDEAAQAEVYEGLVREAERSSAFRFRCREAVERGFRLRRAFSSENASPRQRSEEVLRFLSSDQVKELRQALSALERHGEADPEGTGA